MGVLKAVAWKAVESSLFTAAAYRPEARQLYLRFRDGNIYRYFDFTAEMYESFLAAESKGRYFSSHIRDRFRYEQVRYVHRRTGRSTERTAITAGSLPMQPA
jgi:KTSC domain